MTTPNPDDRWYFAYGSNLDVDQKTLRTGTIRCALPARLPEYRLVFNKRGLNGNIYANIVPDLHSVVWGVAYLCCPDAIDAMEERGGVSAGHYRHESVTVMQEDDTELRALTYFAGEQHICHNGRPKDDYLQKILRGARHHGLPNEYVTEIERIAVDPMVG